MQVFPAVAAAAVFLLLLTPGRSLAQTCFDMRTLWPLESGNFWRYRDEVSGTIETLRVMSRRVTINGVSTVRLSSNLATTYQTNDGNGLRLFRRDATVDGTNVVITYDPRIARTGSSACIGDVQRESGMALIDVSGSGSFTINYSSTSRVVRVEPVSVLGTSFDALRIEWNTRVFGTIDGDSIDEDVAETVWFVDELGLVRQQIVAAGVRSDAFLIESNLALRRSDLNIIISPLDDVVRASERFGYTVTLSNSGPDFARNAVVTLPLWDGAGVPEFLTSDWRCDATAEPVTCSRPSSMGTRGASGLTVFAAAPPRLGNLVIEASISSDEPDPSPGNNTASATVSVRAAGAGAAVVPILIDLVLEDE